MLQAKETIKPRGETKTPVYMQIVDHVKLLVMSSKMHPHEQVQSVRSLAKELGINPTLCKRLTPY
jgi:GntR family transcriptional regulator